MKYEDGEYYGNMKRLKASLSPNKQATLVNPVLNEKNRKAPRRAF